MELLSDTDSAASECDGDMIVPNGTIAYSGRFIDSVPMTNICRDVMKDRATESGVLMSSMIYGALIDNRVEDEVSRFRNADEQILNCFGPSIRLKDAPAAVFITGVFDADGR